MSVVAKGSHGSAPCIQSPVMQKTLDIAKRTAKAKRSLFWGIVNAILCSILFYDSMYSCPSYALWVRVTEVVLIVAFMLNTIFHLGTYYFNTAYLAPVSVTPEQKRLLGLHETDQYIKVHTPLPTSSTNTSISVPATPMNLSAVSWLSSGSSPGTSHNYTMSAASWEYLPNTSRHTSISSKGSPESTHVSPHSLDISHFSSTSSIGFIDDDQKLSRYLSEYDDYEKSLEQSSSAYWKNSSGKFKIESPSFRGCNYQLSPPISGQKTGAAGELPDESRGSLSSAFKGQDVWARIGVDRTVLPQWTSNLRRWLSETIFERIVREIDTMDVAFQRAGLSDIKIGFVGLERLKKTVQMSQVMHNMPTFPLLVHFLELTSNQEYLVTRIRELAKGGCMSEFRWNNGGKLHGKDWDEHLPSDAALTIFLLATYFDTQLPPLPHNPEGQPFTSEYLIRAPNKVPEGRNSPVIREVQVNPPHYCVSIRGEDFDVGKGRNNLFHTILLFLRQMYTKEHGMLGKVNMGPSGINVLWVIDR